jgi:hypothetical protein
MIYGNDSILNHDHLSNIFSLIHTLKNCVVMRDARFPMRCSLPPRSSGLLCSINWFLVNDVSEELIGSIFKGKAWKNGHWRLYRQAVTLYLTLSLLMSYIYGAPCKARNFNVVYIWTYFWQRWKPSLSICCTMFQQRINGESFPVAKLCVNILLATKINLITDGI